LEGRKEGGQERKGRKQRKGSEGSDQVDVNKILSDGKGSKVHRHSVEGSRDLPREKERDGQ
jgi:hypothetical protein